MEIKEYEIEGIPIREEVLRFALRMEMALADNESKGGWEACDFTYLIGRLSNEIEELNEALQYPIFKEEDVPAKQRAIQLESADVANFLMMILDNMGMLELNEEEIKEYQV